MSKPNDYVSNVHEHSINPEVGEIYFYGDVDEESAEKLIKNINILLFQSSSSPIKIFLQSNGGCGQSALSLYNYISSLDVEVTIIVMGYAYSAAPIILQAADKRVCMPYSTIMIHEGNMHMSETLSNSNEYIKVVNKEMDDMLEIFAQKMGATSRVLKNKFKIDTYYTAEEALEAGLIDEIWGQ